MKIFKIYTFICLTSLSFNIFANVDPSSLKLKIYQVAVALNTDCSSPRVIFTSATGSEVDFISNPVLGRGNPGDGTYNCIMVTMDDVIKFTPVSTTGSCTGGVEYSLDTCRDQVSSNNLPMSSHTDLLIDTTFTETECQGTAQMGSGIVPNKVTMYIRTSAPESSNPNSDFVSVFKSGVSAINDNGSGKPTAITNNGIHLTNPFVVSGSRSGVFYADATSNVDGNNTNCEMMPPKFGFRYP